MKRFHTEAMLCPCCAQRSAPTNFDHDCGQSLIRYLHLATKRFSFSYLICFHPSPPPSQQPTIKSYFPPKSVPTTCPPTHNPFFRSDKGLTLETSAIYFPQGLPSAWPTFGCQPGVSPHWRCVFIPGAVCTPSAAQSTWLTRGLVFCEEPGSTHPYKAVNLGVPLLCRLQRRADAAARLPPRIHPER